MLLRLRLANFVIVDSAELVFGSGFTVLSGETGAGKSILLDALMLALGGRADAGVVRDGCERADIVAEFAADGALDEWLAERELQGDAGLVLLRRVVDADGRSRAFVNGHPSTAALLREIGERLVEIHGQHASQSLLRADGQRRLLDGFGALDALAASVAAAFADWRTALRALEAAEHGARELALERERLEWQLGELEALRIERDEWETLEVEQKRLSHAASLVEGAGSAAEALVESDDALLAQLQRTVQRLRPLAAIDEALAEPLQLLDSAAIQVDEAASTLREYASRVELDPQRLEQVDARIGALFSAARKLRLAPQALYDECAQLRERVRALDAAQDVDALRESAAQLRSAYDALAAQLSQRRRDAAARLAEGVTRHVALLGMKGGRVEIAVEAAEPSASGADAVEFRVAAHAGVSPRPLARVASGGELSRIALAITTVAAQANPVPTLVFDEADAGVGGAVAEAVGELMRSLGESRQVLCVTHLPQVAAKAHRHWRVSKNTVGRTTVSVIEPLERNARVDEIARMLGGADITATTRRHAREMLAQGR
ncbi:MAG: DNA repair protein RecN [Burkholderiaceae bacterium]|nr:DNA repair protein RecN [Burkholderiaceae bacterium]